MKTYTPGLHIIATLQTEHALRLGTYEDFKILADDMVQKFNLEKLGEVYHNFHPGGFTGVVCLSESHISLHTWPEYNKINFDIYLSNYLRENDGTVVEIFDLVKTFFEADVVYQQNIRR